MAKGVERLDKISTGIVEEYEDISKPVKKLVQKSLEAAGRTSAAVEGLVKFAGGALPLLIGGIFLGAGVLAKKGIDYLAALDKDFGWGYKLVLEKFRGLKLKPAT